MKVNKTIYRGFVIERHDVGRTPGQQYQYQCGNARAPRKKDIMRDIDRVYEWIDYLGHSDQVPIVEELLNKKSNDQIQNNKRGLPKIY